MTILHKDIQSADCHEPKGITTADTTDSGKVITPSSTVAGTSVLRSLSAGKDLDLRIVALTDAATIASDSDTTDQGTVTLGGSRTLGAPSGTPRNGQEITYRVTQDGTGNRVLSFDAVFTFQGSLPAPDLTAGTVAYYTFRWNSGTNKWEQYVRPVGGPAYSGKTIKNNTTVIAVPAMTDTTNFSTVADWRQITGIFEADVAPNANVTRGTNDLTILVTGVYYIEAHVSVESSVNNTRAALAFAVNGVVVPDRPIINNLPSSGVPQGLGTHAYVTLTAGQVISAWVAGSAAANILVRQCRFSLELVARTV